jgi:copper transport protein
VTILLAAAASARLSMPVVWETGVARWLLFAGLSVAVGGLTGRGLAGQYKGNFPVPLPGPWALRGSLLGALASAWLALIILGGADFLAGFAHLPHLFSTTQGAVAGVEVVAFLLAAGLLRLRQPGWSWVPLTGVIVAEGIRAHPETIIPVVGALITYCHLLPAAMWSGMLLYVLRVAVLWRNHPEDMRGLVRLYATAAAWLFATLVVSGVISALVLVPLGSLLTTTYGIVLIVKAAVVAVAAGLAVVGRVWLRRRPQRGAGPARVTKLECAALAAALAVAGLLTALTPPATPVRHSAAPARPATQIRSGAAPARPATQPRAGG